MTLRYTYWLASLMLSTSSVKGFRILRSDSKLALLEFCYTKEDVKWMPMRVLCFQDEVNELQNKGIHKENIHSIHAEQFSKCKERKIIELDTSGEKSYTHQKWEDMLTEIKHSIRYTDSDHQIRSIHRKNYIKRKNRSSRKKRWKEVKDSTFLEGLESTVLLEGDKTHFRSLNKEVCQFLLDEIQRKKGRFLILSKHRVVDSRDIPWSLAVIVLLCIGIAYLSGEAEATTDDPSDLPTSVSSSTFQEAVG